MLVKRGSSRRADQDRFGCNAGRRLAVVVPFVTCYIDAKLPVLLQHVKVIICVTGNANTMSNIQDTKIKIENENLKICKRGE